LEKLTAFWAGFVQFLKEYDSNKIAAVLREIDWAALARSPAAWIVGVPLVLLMIWKKQVKLMVLGISMVLFMALLQHTLAAPGESMSLEKLVQFIGGAIALAGVNLYFFFMRQS
jgi:hypothetical protein